MELTDTGTSTGSSGDFSAPSGADQEMSSLLGDGFDAATGEGGEGSESPEAQIIDPAQGDQPSREAEAQPQEGEAAPGEYPLSPDGSSYMVPKDALPGLKASQDFHSQVSQFFSSAQEAQIGAQQASDLRKMSNDWMFGSPEALQGWLSHWAGANAPSPQIASKYQAAFGAMAQQIPQLLAQVNPQAHQALSQRFITSAIDAAYQKAAQSGNPDDLVSAQSIEWGLTGQYKTEAPKLSPVDQAQTQFQREQQAFNQRQGAALQRDLAAFDQTTLEGAKYSQLQAKIDTILNEAQRKAGVKFSEVTLKDIKLGIRRDLVDKVRSSNPDWWTEHEQAFHGIVQDFRTTWAQGSPGAGLQPRVQAYISDFLSRASKALGPIVQARLSAATGARKTPSNGASRTTQPRSPAPNRAGSNGSPQPPQRLSSDEWDRQLAAAMTIR